MGQKRTSRPNYFGATFAIVRSSLNCMNVAAVPENVCTVQGTNFLSTDWPIGDALKGGEASMTVRTDHHSDYDPAQLVLYGAAAIVLLVYAWTFVY